MNTLIAAFVGAALSTVSVVAGVNAAQGDQKPVSNDQLYSYADQ